VNKYLILILTILLTSSLFAQNKIDSLKTIIKNYPDNIPALIALGVHYHDLGVEGDKKAVDKGKKNFEKVLSLDSTNAFITGYYGSILSLKARDAKMPWTKIKYAKKGFEHLDKSIQMNPEDLDVRLIRAMNSYQVPKIMKRISVAIEDFNFIIENKTFESWTADHKAFVYLHYGKALEKDNQDEKSREFFELAAKIAPQSKSGIEARAKLGY
jgi:tetratricopeptide (TPR) repeat protein